MLGWQKNPFALEEFICIVSDKAQMAFNQEIRIVTVAPFSL